jgi:DNA repair protein RecN (Recombination protein N)
MLCNLVVENYALIDSLSIAFKGGLTMITGETGAGKSILLGALSLLLGKRADTGVLLDKGKKCIVEGTFDISRYGIEAFFTDNAIDYEDQTVVRREIAATGKSRAFINDTPVNLDQLSSFAGNLIDIHSQHQNLELSNSQFQMLVVDNYAGTTAMLDQYRGQYRLFRETELKLGQMRDQSAQMKAELDYHLFQFNQLEEAKLIHGEQQELELEQEQLTHAEEIKSALSATVALLEGEDPSALQFLKDTIAQLGRIRRYLPEGEDLIRRLESVYIDLKDIARETGSLNDRHNPDPDALQRVNERLNLLFDLLKKHRVVAVDELITLREQLREKISVTDSFDNRLAELEKELESFRSRMQELADILRQKRKSTLPAFEEKVTSMLHEVGMPNAGFRVEHEPIDDFGEHGIDRFRFLFASGRNLPLQDISKVASGGEMSRLMLCIKSLLVDASGLPILVFDEIDTGISGEIAERVGNIIVRMAGKMQIINITHLPQIASKGQQHYLVYKTEEDHSSVTRMRLLNPDERHLEIARMLSGEEITRAALDHARALLGK